ncbi:MULTISPECIES: phosphoketolase family protein [unclassified Leptolyngbya]|uniref:phosphoketolase family protein n=1 Tax=unclassified Leptolyngbya TaxID=2650499 RepID=UPI001686D1DF|nr:MULTISPECIES: phosphoketolase family protein [unclassified Leptolyngbya]MBD1913896.1 phosphoketolase family protein [Leptolyngbya sp. FACHB-8]MBD2156348.1 phosphoketolase family protein [Leptolyngbya sp. FACHB-16]
MVATPERPTLTGNPLSEEELRKTHAYWRACNYLALGMIYLKGNPLLREPLKAEHVKKRLLGHWGSSPGLSFIYVHANRLIKKYDQNMVYVAGPGHGAPGFLAPVYMEGSYSEIYPDKSEDIEGMYKFFKQFSFPGGIGSHATPETPGSIHEGGELGYSLSHSYGIALDNPDLIVLGVVGDGEAETGPLATSWHSNKFINPARDGAVLPILHLNGYKIANPTILARISHDELESLFRGYGYKPYFVEGSDPQYMHQAMAAAMESAVQDIHAIWREARSEGVTRRPEWPMIILRSPKGWTAPAEIDGRKVEGFWRSHQVPMADLQTNPAHVQVLEQWLRSYGPEELFDQNGTLIPELKDLAPVGHRRMGSNPITNGGLVRKELRMPNFRDYAVDVPSPGTVEAENTKPLGIFLRDIMKNNPTNFRMMGPDETASNRLTAPYEVTKKTWMAEMLPEDLDGSELAQDGRVMEMLSEHTLVGWLEGYLLSGRHGFFHTYEAFAHVISSMFNQHAKWLDICKHHVPWRAPVSSWNVLLSSTVWRQDHNGFSHQDPGFVDVVTNKDPSVVRIYFPPDANCLLSVADHCFRSTNYTNVIVSDKQKHMQYLDIEQAIKHCTKGVGIWDWACNDDCGTEPDEPEVVMACCGDVPTRESLAATGILRDEFPYLKVRFINVVDLLTLMPQEEHPHGMSEREFDALFTPDKPVIFNFHGYPWLIHKLTYRRTNQDRIHVRGYKEKGNINTPLELAIRNNVDRFSLVIDVIDRVPSLGSRAAHVRERMKNEIIDNLNYAHEYGADKDEITHWTWPHGSSACP